MGGKGAVFLTLLFASCLFIGLISIPSFSVSAVRVYVDPPVVVDPSVLFNVSIKVDNVLDLAGAEWKLTWDPALLKVVNMKEVMFHEITPKTEWDNIWQIISEVDNVVGSASYAYTFVDQGIARDGGYCPIVGNHTMAILTFQVISMGNCSLHFETSKLGNTEASAIEHDTTDGFFSNSVPPPPIPPGPIEDSQLLFYFTPRRVRNESLIVDDTFSVALEVDSISVHHGIVDLGFGLEWNSTLLDCTGVTESLFHEVTPLNESGNIQTSVLMNNSGGQLFHYATLTEDGYRQALAEGYMPIFGNHTVAVVTFTVKNFGKCLLHLDYCRASDVNDTTILYSAFDGYFSNMVNGDLNGDNHVDLFDAVTFAGSFGMFPGYPRWNEEADINGDGIIDVFDAIMLIRCFGNSR
jgi:hypothetical protein